MKPKQLANVLIKILGLSVCAHAIPTLVSRVMIVFTPFQSVRFDVGMMQVFSTAVVFAVEIAVGIFLIGMSQKIADLLLKEEDE